MPYIEVPPPLAEGSSDDEGEESEESEEGEDEAMPEIAHEETKESNGDKIALLMHKGEEGARNEADAKEADEARPIAMVKKWPIVTVKRDLLQE